MSANENEIQRYLAQLKQAQTNRLAKPLSLEERRELALSMGFSPSEFEAVEQRFADHVLRANGFINFENWTDALSELELAQTIHPVDVDVFYLKALCYYQLAQTPNPKAKFFGQEAERHARQALDLEPWHRGSLEIVSGLRQLGEIASPPPPPRQVVEQSSGFGAIAFFSLVLAVVAIWLVVARQEASTPISPEAQAQSFDLSQEQAQSNTEKRAKDFPSLSTQGQTVLELGPQLKIPLVLHEDSKAYGLHFRIEESFIQNYGTASKSSNAIIRGYFRPQGFPLTQLEIEFETLDAQGKVLSIQRKDLHQNFKTYALQDDGWYPFTINDFKKESFSAAVAKFRFRVTKVSANQLPRLSLSKTNYSWRVSPRPPSAAEAALYQEHLGGLKIQTYYDAFRSNTFMTQGEKKVNHDLVIEIENLHSRHEIRGLRGLLEWQDEQGKRVEDKQVFILSNADGLALRPGQKARYTLFGYQLPENVARYHLYLTELELSK